MNRIACLATVDADVKAPHSMTPDPIKEQRLQSILTAPMPVSSLVSISWLYNIGGKVEVLTALLVVLFNVLSFGHATIHRTFGQDPRKLLRVASAACLRMAPNQPSLAMPESLHSN